MSVSQKGKNGRWYCEFMIAGERYYFTCEGAKDKNEAKKFETKIKAKILEGEEKKKNNKNKILLSEMTEKYLNYSRVNKPASYSHDKYYKNYWLSFFGDKPLNEIKPIDIECYKTHRLEEDGKSPATVNREKNSLSKMFSLAVQNGYIKENPCSGVKNLRVQNHKIRFLTKEEEKRFLKRTEGHWIKPLLITALHTGMRQGEILSLTWDCVNFEQNYIDVLRTKNGVPRQIPMSAKLRTTLQELFEITESDYVFVNPISKNRHCARNIQEVFNFFTEKAEIKKLTFHDLRHTAATRMVEKGTDLVVVKEILGHKNITTTMRYAHPVPEIKAKAIQFLNDY